MRPITPTEFQAIKHRYNLTDDDISDPFLKPAGIYVQIRIPEDQNAAVLESELRNKEIEVLNGSPYRLDILTGGK